jgi:arylformamidase
VAHLALLGAGVVVVEGLDLREPPPGDYDLWCLPLKVAGGDGAPARVVLGRR